MRRLARLFVFAGACAAVAGCFVTHETKTSGGEDSSVFTGSLKTEERTVGGFHRIRVSSAIEATVTIGSPQKVTIQASESAMAAIGTRLDGDTLVIEVIKPMNESGPMRATIVVPSLDEIEASGASTVKVDAIKAAKLEVFVTGASRTTVQCSVDSLKVRASGASTASFAGDVHAGDYEAVGASTIDLKSVKSQDAKANCSAASTIKFGQLAKGDFEASGASTITYPQGAQISRSDSSGASSIRAE